MTDKEKLEKIKELADAMYYAAMYLTTDASRLHKAMDEYHKFIIHECKEEPASEELEEAAWFYADRKACLDKSVFTQKEVNEKRSKLEYNWEDIRIAFKAGAKWQKTKDESTTEDLGEYINKLSKRFTEVSFAKLSRIAVRVAKWQKEHLWKPADGDDLPEIDREVIALLDNGKVVFAHRPPEYWDGKDIATGKVTRYYPKTYDKGGWNIPNVRWWLDCLMPKEIEL